MRGECLRVLVTGAIRAGSRGQAAVVVTGPGRGRGVDRGAGKKPVLVQSALEMTRAQHVERG